MRKPSSTHKPSYSYKKEIKKFVHLLTSPSKSCFCCWVIQFVTLRLFKKSWPMEQYFFERRLIYYGKTPIFKIYLSRIEIWDYVCILYEQHMHTLHIKLLAVWQGKFSSWLPRNSFDLCVFSSMLFLTTYCTHFHMNNILLIFKEYYNLPYQVGRRLIVVEWWIDIKMTPANNTIEYNLVCDQRM